MKKYVLASIIYIVIAVTMVSYWSIKIRKDKADIQNPAVSEIIPLSESSDHEQN